MKIFSLFIAIFLSISTISNGQVLVDASNSVCAINNNGQFDSTAFCIKEDVNQYYFLTAGHTIDACLKYDIELDVNELKLDLTLTHDGYQKEYSDVVRVVRHVYEVNTINDLALLVIDKNDIHDYKNFSVARLAERNTDITPGRLIWTYGAPNGAWPTAFKGRIISSEGQNITCQAEKDGILFYPPVKYGRSGSPLYNFSVRRVVGLVILTKRVGNGEGPAVSSTAVPYTRINEFLNTN